MIVRNYQKDTFHPSNFQQMATSHSNLHSLSLTIFTSRTPNFQIKHQSPLTSHKPKHKRLFAVSNSAFPNKDNGFNLFDCFKIHLRPVLHGGGWWNLSGDDHGVEDSTAKPITVWMALSRMWTLIGEVKWLIYLAVAYLTVAAVPLMSFYAPNSLATLLESAVSTHSSTLGRTVHAYVIRTLATPLPTFLSNHLINMYSKLDLPNSAQLVLQLTPVSSRSVVTWTALIAGHVQNRRFASAFLHFSNMRRECVRPNDFTFPCLFKAVASLHAPVTGKQVHALALKSGQIHDVFVGCSAFDMYSKTGLREEAKKMFEEMPERNLATWNAYISNAVLGGQPRDAVLGFIEFRRVGGQPNSITFCAFLNACSDDLWLELGRQLHGFVIRSGFDGNVSVCNGLIDFYGKCREIGCAELVFDEISEKNVVSWCTVVAICMQNDEEEKACEMFLRARKEGVEPTDFMVSSVLSACAGIAGLELGRSVHALAVKACVEGNIFVGSALVDMYGKCGSVDDSE